MSDTPAALVTDGDAIDIHVPLRTEHAATLRVIVASLGADHGLSLDEIDDLKLAVSEVFTSLIDDDEHGPPQRVHVRYTADDTALTVALERPDPATPVELDTLAAAILSSVVDEYRMTDTGVTLVKHAGESAR